MIRREMPMTRLRRRVGQRVRRMSVEQLQQWLAAHDANWRAHKSIISEPIKQLTGGLNSQSINAYVVRRVYDELRAKRLNLPAIIAANIRFRNPKPRKD